MRLEAKLMIILNNHDLITDLQSRTIQLIIILNAETLKVELVFYIKEYIWFVEMSTSC